jgi:kynurenine formamidase
VDACPQCPRIFSGCPKSRKQTHGYTVGLPALTDLINAIGGCRAIDLAQPYHIGIPHFPLHAPFMYSLSKKHGESVHPSGASSAAEAITLSTHTGTHIDALCHYSSKGKLHGGEATSGTYAGGIEKLSVDTMQPIFRRGVLLDIARLHALDVLPVDFVITPEHLERAAAGLEIKAGDVVLLRTGWSKYWDDPAKFISQLHSPGPKLAGARWLSERKVFAAGSETAPFEFMPSPEMEVHVHLLVESGIHIIENLNLEDLAASGAREFLFVATPLKIRGGTASPIRPYALVPEGATS